MSNMMTETKAVHTNEICMILLRKSCILVWWIPPFDNQSGVSHPQFELSRLRNSPKFSAPHFATISLMPGSKGHKPKHNDNNSCECYAMA